MVKAVFMGIQGSGKGTQAKLLAERFGLRHINVGELFRWNIQNQTPIGREARRYVENGLLVPDSVVFSILEDAMKGADKGYIVDGFPRNLAQAEYLMAHYPIDKVVLFHLDDETAIERVEARRLCIRCNIDYNLITKKPLNDSVCDNCGEELVQRMDDRREAIQKRLSEFHNQTDPVIGYFRDLGLVTEIPADQTVDMIHQQVITALGL